MSFGTMSTGAVIKDTDDCTCAYPDYGGYSMHEDHCGLELIGFLSEEAAVMHGFDPYPEPDLLPTMLWDFSSVDHFVGMGPS